MSPDLIITHCRMCISYKLEKRKQGRYMLMMTNDYDEVVIMGPILTNSLVISLTLPVF